MLGCCWSEIFKLGWRTPRKSLQLLMGIPDVILPAVRACQLYSPDRASIIGRKTSRHAFYRKRKIALPKEVRGSWAGNLACIMSSF